MILHALTAAPPASVAEALERFEEQFTYPLGPGRSFRISHGPDYTRFFRAMGEAVCLVAESDGLVVAALALALRRLRTPEGDERLVAYLGDLKIAPTARGGWALARLAREAGEYLGARTQSAFAVVMDGTRATPEQYTGRLGIPAFTDLGKIAVLRLLTRDAVAEDEAWRTSEEYGAACYARLSAGCFASPGGFPAERSEMDPRWLAAPDGGACGRLEDTRRAKRLLAEEGEMRSAHLSCFAFRDARAGAALLRVACAAAAAAGFPALFTAVPASQAPAFREALTGVEMVEAPATVYGAGLPPWPDWNINTAEI